MSDAEEEVAPLLYGHDSPIMVDKRRRAINLQNWLYPHHHFSFEDSREACRHYLSSKAGHYFVLGLVSLDVSAIIADFIIRLFKCEKEWGEQGWDEALDALGIVGLIFSTLFLIELLAAVWAFGSSYFHSKFHVFDAIVIVAGFTLDVLLHGPLEEAASLIIILRLWRVFKIIEELSVGASEQIDHLSEEISLLQGEKIKLKQELLQSQRQYEELKMKGGSEANKKNGERAETPPTPD